MAFSKKPFQLKPLFSLTLVLFFHTQILADTSKENVSILFKWFHQYQFAGYIMAKEKGFYDELGLNVTLLQRDPKFDNIQEVVDGKAQYGIADSSILLYRAKGFPLKVVATIFQHNALVLLAKKSSGIVSPYEMKGKVISFQKGIDETTAVSMLDFAGLTHDDFVHVPLDFTYQQFLNGEVDVVTGYITDQPYTFKKLGYEINIINPASYGIDLYGDLLFTTDQELQTHPKRVKKMKEASLKGWRYALENIDETIQIIREKYNPSLSYDQLLYEAQMTKRLIAMKHVELGYTSEDRFKIIASFYNLPDLKKEEINSAIDDLIYDPNHEKNLLKKYLFIILIVVLISTAISALLYIYNRRLMFLVQERTSELEEAKKISDEATKAKSEFLANMSHEIRTPMSSVLGMTNLALQTQLNEKQKNYIQKANIAAKNLLGIINDILDFSKFESSQFELYNTHFELQELINHAIELTSVSAQEKNLSIIVHTDPNLPKVFFADSLRLGQVLINLLSNAVKFSHNDTNVEINILLQAEDNHSILVLFSVKDYGIGISKENQAQLFDSFSQATSSITKDFGGTGLGLAICKKIVDRMDGEIWLDSQKDQGSTFSFKVRLEKSNESNVETLENSSSSLDLEIENLHGAKILLVEDHELNQELILDALALNDIDVTIANNGEEALEILQTDSFDLILMDIQMPVMDGYEATKRIRAQEKYKTLPILALTANVLTEDVAKAKKAGMNDHVAKPVDFNQLYKKILEHTRHKTLLKETITKESLKEESFESMDHEELPSFETIDADYALSLFLYNTNAFTKLLQGFKKYKNFDFESLNTEEYTRAMHSLKGVSASLGADRLNQLAYEMEKTASKENLQELIAEIYLIIDEIERKLPEL